MLKLDEVHSYYGDAHILQGVSLKVEQGALVALLGRNGAGKSTTLKTIMGLVRPRHGQITFAGRNIASLPSEEIARLGVGYVPEDRGIIPNLTVAENLRLGMLGSRVRGGFPDRLARAFDYFPALRTLMKRRGGLLSGGEQQMLTLARALVASPTLMLIDEPTEGLSPTLVQSLVGSLQQINAAGATILLVEQNLEIALAISNYCYVLDQGRVRFHGSPLELISNQRLKQQLLGV